MEKKNILVVTLQGRAWNNNYGATLQALALQQFLVSRGFRVTVLDLHPKLSAQKAGGLVKRFFRSYRKQKNKVLWILSLPKKISSKLLQSFIRRYIRGCEQQRLQTFQRWRAEFLCFSDMSYSSFFELEAQSADFEERFDIFVVGSDQVWNIRLDNETLKLLDIFLLNFVRTKPKISYAASVSCMIPDSLYPKYRNALSRFSAISVRERWSAEEIYKATGINLFIALDPTLLLKPDDWDRYARWSTRTPSEEFVFVYDLYRSKEILGAVEKTAKTEKFVYVNFHPYALLPWNKLKYRNLLLNYYDKDPGEFLWLLRNSKFVITSSFHGTVFAIIFRKPFYSILWPEKEEKKRRQRQNERILYLLDKLGLKDRAFEDPKEILKRGLDFNIDWESVHKKLDALRKESQEWLLNALNDALEKETRGN